VEGDLVGKVLFYGEGAGPYPTSSAVVADVVSVAQDILLCSGPRVKWQPRARNIKPMADLITRYYIRMSVSDQAGVLTQITRVLGDNNISISACIQKEADAVNQSAEIVIMTHPANEAAMQKAIREMGQLSVVKEISNFIRVEDV
jgi:homoserine dehydrogenase